MHFLTINIRRRIIKGDCSLQGQVHFLIYFFIYIFSLNSWVGDMLEEPADGKAWWFWGWIGMCVSQRSIEFWWRSVPLWPKTVITAVTNWTRRRSVSLMPALLRRLCHWSVAARKRHILALQWTKMLHGISLCGLLPSALNGTLNISVFAALKRT